MSIFDILTMNPGDNASADVLSVQAEEPSQSPTDSSGEADTGLTDVTDFTPRDVKDACQELLRFGLLEAARKPNLYRTATTQLAAVNRILEPLDLALKIDDIRGLAYVIVAQPVFAQGEDEWSHPLVRRQRLTLEQSLVVALLRQHYLVHEQERGVGAADAPMMVEELVPQLQLYLGNLGSDVREVQRARTLLDKLKSHGLVSDVDQQDQFVIRPIIVHLANPENLQGLLAALRGVGRAQAQQGDSESLVIAEGA